MEALSLYAKLMNEDYAMYTKLQTQHDVHMYMGQPPVYSPAAEGMSYQPPANQPSSYNSTPNPGLSLPPTPDTQQHPYPEKALL
ncbi:unnamed protein product [Coregonus sp. 'balchen']|nr:unnamed protein product [Coregonus sp. 'balchen']